MFQRKVLLVLSFLCHFKQEEIKIGDYATKSAVKSESFFFQVNLYKCEIYFSYLKDKYYLCCSRLLKIILKLKKAVLQIKLV